VALHIVSVVLKERQTITDCMIVSEKAQFHGDSGREGGRSLTVSRVRC
jgi:hypothetical protein